jgi:hypothetical protein
LGLRGHLCYGCGCRSELPYFFDNT